jgi:primosomal protein N' (replication factor Y)
MKYTQVALAVPLDKTFTYTVTSEQNPDNTSLFGRRVLVNFHNRKLTGYVVAESDTTDCTYQIKNVEKVIDQTPIFHPFMLEFAKWISSYYFCSVGEALSLMVPRGIRPKTLPLLPARQVEPATLTDEQQAAYDGIKNDLEHNQKMFYLYGITGSGKTEVYIKLMEDTLAAGKSVIFLVPEIAMSYQTLERLQARFGNLCAVLHSALTASTRLGEYLRLFNGEARIAIGPRSALFAPLCDTGLIIIDEEHESAYKSDESPRFQARSAAFQLAKIMNAAVVLGSATPSVESWYHTQKGFLKLYTLSKRYQGALLPEVRIIDTSALSQDRILSPQMAEEINRRLQNGEQVLLLQNRRGFSSCLQCTSCKEVIECPRCSVNLTYHQVKNKLICHRCGYSSNIPTSCPSCHEKKFKKLGAGTEKVEDEVRKIFAGAKLVRIDYDTVQSSKNLQETFRQIADGEIKIIIGTQIIAKGLHFPGIKFVGIINADLFLNIPDFKSAERAFALITQAAGRAGREGERGLVMVQTINPDHYAISIKDGFSTFYTNEIFYREATEMPPFFRLIRLVVRSGDEATAKNECDKLRNLLDWLLETMPNQEERESIQIMGAAACLLTRINNNFRYHILLKSKNLQSIRKLVKQMTKKMERLPKNTYLEIDTDPADLF